MNKTLQEELQDVFRNVFENPALIITDVSTAADISGWDSLTHMHLLHNIETHFGITFSFAEVSSFNNVGDMLRAIEKKKKS